MYFIRTYIDMYTVTYVLKYAYKIHVFVTMKMYACMVQPRGNVALARIVLSSGEFDSIVSQVYLLFYNTNSEKLQWIYACRPCHSTS